MTFPALSTACFEIKVSSLGHAHWKMGNVFINILERICVVPDGSFATMRPLEVKPTSLYQYILNVNKSYFKHHIPMDVVVNREAGQLLTQFEYVPGAKDCVLFTDGKVASLESFPGSTQRDYSLRWQQHHNHIEAQFLVSRRKEKKFERIYFWDVFWEAKFENTMLREWIEINTVIETFWTISLEVDYTKLYYFNIRIVRSKYDRCDLKSFNKIKLVIECLDTSLDSSQVRHVVNILKAYYVICQQNLPQIHPLISPIHYAGCLPSIEAVMKSIRLVSNQTKSEPSRDPRVQQFIWDLLPKDKY